MQLFYSLTILLAKGFQGGHIGGAAILSRLYSTTFTIFFGTTMTFLGVLPSR